MPHPGGGGGNPTGTPDADLLITDEPVKTLPPASLLTPLSQFLAARMGLHFPRERWGELARGLEAAAEEFGFEDAESCGEWLLGAPLNRRQVEILAGNLTIGETYFFREKKSFEILEREILPELIRARRGGAQRLRIWSAGCCTGEEPYSIAMALRLALPDFSKWAVTLLATDINPHFLRKAADGIYGDWSFRSMPARMKERFFHKCACGRWQIAREIREMVTFGYLNLADDVYPSLLNNTNAMDVIFCRNVLMYFTPEAAARVIDGFHHALVDGGWLLVGPSELPQVHGSPFTAVSFPGAIIHRKEPRQVPEKPVEVPPPAAVSEPPTPMPPAPYDRAVAMYELGRYDEAAKILLEGAADKADPHADALLARAYANQGRLAEGLAACEKAIAADKLHAAYHYLRATILQEQGAVDEAVPALKRALYLDPRFVLAHFALGNLAHMRGAHDEAHKHFSNALQLLRLEPPERALPESDGITAGRLTAIIATLTETEPVP